MLSMRRPNKLSHRSPHRPLSTVLLSRILLLILVCFWDSNSDGKPVVFVDSYCTICIEFSSEMYDYPDSFGRDICNKTGLAIQLKRRVTDNESYN